MRVLIARDDDQLHRIESSIAHIESRSRPQNDARWRACWRRCRTKEPSFLGTAPGRGGFRSEMLLQLDRYAMPDSMINIKRTSGTRETVPDVWRCFRNEIDRCSIASPAESGCRRCAGCSSSSPCCGRRSLRSGAAISCRIGGSHADL